MYGLVFEIVEQFVIDSHGIDAWHAVKEKAGCPVKDHSFLRRSYYPDEDLVGLVVAASELLGAPVDTILEAFGTYFTQYHFLNGNDDLLRCQGSTLRQWLSNLNAMHIHIQKSFPVGKFIAPVFWCEDCEDVPGSILLHYFSFRGKLLAPFVVGIVIELAKTVFGVEVQMEQRKVQDEDGAPFTTWRISTVDPEKNWKLAPRGEDGMPLPIDEVDFDEIKLPTKCPFTGKNLSSNNTDERTSSNPADPADPGQASQSKCPFSAQHEETPQTTSHTSETSITAMPDHSTGLTLQKMKEIFPFHVLVQRDFLILQVGHCLPKLLDINEPEFIGAHIQEFLEINRPVLGSEWDWKALSKLADQHFFLGPKSKSEQTLPRRVCMEQGGFIKFQGSMISVTADTVMFVLVPDAYNVGDLRNMGLTMSDLPLHSCQRDAVFLGEYISQEVDKAHKLDKLSKRLTYEKHLSNTLLYNMLPKQIADDLRSGKTVEPTYHEHVTLFFSDIEGFTSICDQVDPWDVIDMLNQLYSVMDYLATHFNLYKVETVGDAYMCCSGLPEPDEYHAENIANFALAVVECVKHIKSPADGSPLNLRIGIHTGSCTSGVVGTLTPHYCLFGDMVNTTARHESTGLSGRIHCSSVLFGHLKHFSKFGDKEQYNFTPRGLVQMKGKSDSYTYWLDRGTAANEAAGPSALNTLSIKVREMLAKKRWKRERYCLRNLRDETMSVATTLTSSSCESSVSEVTASNGNASQSDNGSITGFGSDYDPDSDLDIDDMLEYAEEQDQLKKSTEAEEWSKLRFQNDLPMDELILKVHDRIFSALQACGLEPSSLDIAKDQMLNFIKHLSTLYQAENQFHSFRRSCNVLLCADHLWEKIRAGGEQNDSIVDLNLNGYDDPWDRLILLFACLIYEVKSVGDTNERLRSGRFRRRSAKSSTVSSSQVVHSVLETLETDFTHLYDELMFGCPKFLHYLERMVAFTNSTKSEDVSKRLQMFGETWRRENRSYIAIKKKWLITMEMILHLASLSFYFQDLESYERWSKRSLHEVFRQYRLNGGVNPCIGWNSDQVAIFNTEVKPLLEMMSGCIPWLEALRGFAQVNQQHVEELQFRPVDISLLQIDSINTTPDDGTSQSDRGSLGASSNDSSLGITIMAEMESISKIMEKYEKKILATRNSLLALAHK